MLTAQENELLTRIGPGTPMGALMRRYWHPIGSMTEMSGRWTKRLRILGEDLVLFKTRAGEFGLIAEQCPHRRASLFYGIPTPDGIRCPYHGWKFDRSGACLEQPNEPDGSTFKDKCTTAAYPVALRGGLLWGYLGPLPAPVVPPLPNLDAPGKIRLLGYATIPCNWLQIMENSVDAVHTEWLHGHLPEFWQEQKGFKTNFTRRHLKMAWDEFPYGIIKRRVVEGYTEDDDDWKIGHPVFFPTTLLVGSDTGHMRYQFRIPIDDEHTLHLWYHVITPPAGAEVPPHLLDDVDTYEVPYLDERGEYKLEFIAVQDIMAWITQGPVADRSREALNATDRGLTLYRKMLGGELKRVQAGEDPRNVFRDPQQPEIELPLEQIRRQNDGIGASALFGMFERHDAHFSHVRDDVVKLFRDAIRPKTGVA